MFGREIAATAGTVRLVVVVGMLVALGARFASIGSPVDAMLYGASWITILHLCVGGFVFIRLGAISSAQRRLEVCGVCCVAAMVGAFTRPALWCVALAAMMTVAVVRYVLLFRADARPEVRAYALAKLRGESPAIPFMAVMALLFSSAPADGLAALCLASIILLATTGLAVWMVARRIYPRLLASL